MFKLSMLFVSSLLLGAQAKNDWTVPCITGQCSYDLPSHAKASGSIQLVADKPHSISDITPAAGWTILGCNATALEQNIRLVCNVNGVQSPHCEHLFQNGGAVDKLVRLPENCGASAFARVANAWISEDQTVPPTIASRIARRQGPVVHALALDTNFAAVNASQTGNVSIAIQGSNIPGANDNATVTTANSTRRAYYDYEDNEERGLLSFIQSALASFDSFSINKQDQLSPLNVSHDFPLFSESVTCSPASATVSADLKGTAGAIVTIGAAAEGTIVPPSLSDFGLFASMDADMDGTLNLQGSAVGSLSSGAVPIFSVGIPGLSFPGILTVGPSFVVNAQATGTLDVEANMQVDLAYHIRGAKLFFPPGSGTNAGTFSPGDTPIQLSVSPGVKSTATVSAHLIPGLQVGLNALGGAAQATVGLNLDASATMQLSLQATTSAAVGTNGTSSSTPSFGGCAGLTAGLNVAATAQGNFFSIFNDGTSASLFNKNFQLVNQCFGNSTPSRRAAPRSTRASRLAKRDSLSCPSGLAAAASLLTTTLSGSSIQPTS